MSLDAERHDELVRVKAENEKLRRAIEVFREGYVKKFGRPSTGGVRANAPLQQEVGALLVVWNDAQLKSQG